MNESTNPRINQTGFTLIEALLAMVLFSMLMGIATWGYSQYIKVWEKDLFADKPELDDYQRFTLTRRSVEGLFDYYVTGAQTDFMVPYFQGRASQFSFVTRTPVFSDADVAVARVALIPEGHQYALIYQEMALEGAYLRRADQPLNWEGQMRVMDRVEGYELTYFALSDRGLTEAELAEEEDLRTYQWHTELTGEQGGILPAKIDLQIRKQEAVYRFLFHTGEGFPEKGSEFNARRIFG